MLTLYFTRMLLLRKDTAAFPLRSTSRSACSCRSASRGNAPRPITFVFTPSPVKRAPSDIFSVGKVGSLSLLHICNFSMTFHRTLSCSSRITSWQVPSKMNCSKNGAGVSRGQRPRSQRAAGDGDLSSWLILSLSFCLLIRGDQRKILLTMHHHHRHQSHRTRVMFLRLTVHGAYCLNHTAFVSAAALNDQIL